jgi:hypothetical protein
VEGKEIFCNLGGNPFLKLTPSLLHDDDDDCFPHEDFLSFLQKFHQAAGNPNLSKILNCNITPLSFSHERTDHEHNHSKIKVHLQIKQCI